MERRTPGWCCGGREVKIEVTGTVPVGKGEWLSSGKTVAHLRHMHYAERSVVGERKQGLWGVEGLAVVKYPADRYIVTMLGGIFADGE